MSSLSAATLKSAANLCGMSGITFPEGCYIDVSIVSKFSPGKHIQQHPRIHWLANANTPQLVHSQHYLPNLFSAEPVFWGCSH
jgi:hypothetical protein